MSIAAARRKLTYEDLVRFPEDRRRHEIVNGVHVVTAIPPLRHQEVQFQLNGELYLYLQANPVGQFYPGPIDVLLSSNDIVEPDFVFVSRERLGILTEANIQGVPDLVVETLQPSTRRRDHGLKRARYERLGVGEYWILDPDRDTATVFRRKSPTAPRFQPPLHLSAEADDRLTSPLLPGLELSLRRLFKR